MVQKKVIRRQNRILNEIKLEGEREISELAELVDVSEMTIRRDLKKLEEQGLIIRTPKGARTITQRFLGFSQQSEISKNIVLKREIAATVCERLIKEGQKVFIGPGTTNLTIMKKLPEYFENLEIFTNSLDVTSYEFFHHHFPIHTSGGIVRPDSPCFFGEQAINTLRSWNVDIAFIEADALSPVENGILVYNNSESSVMPHAFSVSDTIFLVADKTKFDTLALYPIAEFKKIQAIVTNKMADNQLYQKFSQFAPIIQSQ